MQIFDSYIEAGQDLNEKNREKYYRALIEFIAYGIEPDLKGEVKAIFTAIKPSLEMSKVKSESGKIGASKRQAKFNSATKQNQKVLASKTQANSNSNSNKEETTKVVSKKNTKFVPPTLEEVKAYCDERQNGINPQKFINHYQANGWMRNKTKIQDWKACVRTWEDREEDSPPTPAPIVDNCEWPGWEECKN